MNNTDKLIHAGRHHVLPILFLILVGYCAFADSDFEVLPNIPGLPDTPQKGYSSFHADETGHLYVLVQGTLLVMNVTETDQRWREAEIEGPIVHLTKNAQGEVFASRQVGADVSFRRLSGMSATEIVNLQNIDSRKISSWYVDGTGRVWVQLGEKKLMIAAKNKDPHIITSDKSKFSFRIRQPCEWKPGHIVFFYKTSLVRANADEVFVENPPEFAADGTGKGPFLIGTNSLVSGGGNNKGAGSHMMNASDPVGSSRRIRLGWHWFHGVGSAPNGRVLVLAQTDHNIKYGFFWYAADGLSQVEVRDADCILRKDRLAKWHLSSTKPVFNSQSTAFFRLQDGRLGIVDDDSARAVQVFTGDKKRGLADIALVDDQLIMMTADGRLVRWHTRSRKDTVQKPTPVPAIVEKIDTTDYERALGQWVSFAKSQGKDMKGAVELLKTPEATLSVLVDLLYSEGIGGEDSKADRLIQQLGDEHFREREAAERELVAMGHKAVAALRKYVSHDDPEIAMRVERITAAFPEASAAAAIREDLKDCAFSILGSSFTLPRSSVEERLRNALAAAKTPELKTEIGALLWLLRRDPDGYQQCVKALMHKESARFNTALDALTAPKYAYQFEEIIRALEPVLAGNDGPRRRHVITRLSGALGGKGVRKIAEVIAPFLVSEDPENRRTAAMALHKLDASGWYDVLNRLAEDHEDTGIRQAASELVNEGNTEERIAE